MTHRTCGICALASVAFLWAGVASVEAVPVQVRDLVGGQGVFHTGTLSWVSSTKTGGAFVPDPVGTIELEMDTGSGWQSFWSYCIEPNQGLAVQVNPPDDTGMAYDLQPLTPSGNLSAVDVDYIQMLWANALTESGSGMIEAAAFQFLVWEMVVDTDLDLQAGLVQLNPADGHSESIRIKAESWVNSIISGDWQDSTPLYALHAPGSQDLLTEIPEPATLGFLALGGLFLLRRSRR